MSMPPYARRRSDGNADRVTHRQAPNPQGHRDRGGVVQQGPAEKLIRFVIGGALIFLEHAAAPQIGYIVFTIYPYRPVVDQ